MADLPEFQSQVKIQGGPQVPSFQSATKELALSPTLLGQIGSTVAMQSSVRLAEHLGYQLGQNPVGDVLPAITKTDEAFVKSYSNQAKATLGLQANQLLQESQLELAKSNRLTPALISAFENNVSQGFSEILENAPSSIRPQLGNQLSNQLLETSGNLSMKLIQQQKQDRLDELNSYNETENTNIFESGISNNFDAAEESLNSFIDRNNFAAESGQIKKSQAKANIHAARLSYWSGVYTREAIDAKNDKNLDAFLSSMVSKKPEEISYSDWNQVGKNVLGYLSNLEKLEARSRNSKLSEIDLKISDGTISQSDLSNLQNDPEISNTDFNNTLRKLESRNVKASKHDIQVSELSNNPTDTATWARTTPEAINDWFDSLVQSKVDSGESEEQAKVNTAAYAPGQIPVLNRELNFDLNSNDPTRLRRASLIANAMQQRDQGHKLNLSKESYAMKDLFTANIQSGVDATTAADMAHKTVFPEDQSVMDVRAKQWNSLEKSKYSKPSQLSKLARDVLNVSSIPFVSTQIPNEELVGNQFSKLLKEYYMLTGDETTAKETVKKLMKNTWGETRFSGESRQAWMPVEKALNLSTNATGYIQSDAVEQLTPEFELTKKAFDEGKSEFYYRFKNPEKFDLNALKTKYDETRVELEKFMQGKSNISKAKESEIFKRFGEAKRNYETIRKGGVIEVEQVFENNVTETFRLDLATDPLLATSTNPESPMVGPYHVRLLNPRGFPQSIANVGANTNQNISYFPNYNRIKEKYRFFEDATDLSSEIKSFLDMQKRIDRRLENKPNEITSTFLF